MIKLRKFKYKSVDSTNTVAHRLIKKGYHSGMVISEKQNKGKGRYGKKWISKNGNIFLSFFFIFKKTISINSLYKSNLLIVSNTIKNMINQKIEIKLPNDLLIQKKKFCGILQEILFFKNLKYLIIGIGINVKHNPLIKGYKTNCLYNYNKKINKNLILARLKKNFEDKYFIK
tara:strand:+ start:74 stop:592 length:519 start_codon:yes stop_codon:yes gene_type:complete